MRVVSDLPDVVACAEMRRPTLGCSSDMASRFWGATASARVPAGRCASRCGYMRGRSAAACVFADLQAAYTVKLGPCGGEDVRARSERNTRPEDLDASYGQRDSRHV